MTTLYRPTRNVLKYSADRLSYVAPVWYEVVFGKIENKRNLSIKFDLEKYVSEMGGCGGVRGGG